MEAFAYFVETVSATYEYHLSEVTCDEELINAVFWVATALITDGGNAILYWELLAHAGRDEEFRVLARRLSRRACAAIQAYVSERSAYALETLRDGMITQRLLKGARYKDAELRGLFQSALALDTVRKYPDRHRGTPGARSTDRRRSDA